MEKKKEIDEKKFIEDMMARAEAMNRGDYSWDTLQRSKKKEDEKMIEKQPEEKQEEEKGYADRFLKKSPATARSGKQIYIRPEYHAKIMQLLFCCGGTASLFSYIDNVLTDHFQHHHDEIEQLICESEIFKKLKP